MADFGMNYRVVLGDLMLLQAFGGTAIPTTVVIDRAGDIAARHVGFTPRKHSKLRSSPRSSKCREEASLPSNPCEAPQAI